MKLLIISAGRYPIPAVKGGAVSTLIENIVDSNSKSKCFDLEIVSPYDMEAEKKAKKYNHCVIHYVKTPVFVNFFDKVVYKVASTIFQKRNIIEFKTIGSFIWFTYCVSKILVSKSYDAVIIENTARLFWCMRLYGNAKKYNGKYYYHLHNEPKKLGGCKNIIISSKKILCISDYIARKIKDKNDSKLYSESIETAVFMNCINTEIFRPYDESVKVRLKKEFGYSEEEKIVVFVGRIDKEKGIKETLEAIKMIKDASIKLLVVGSAFYGMEVKSAFEKEIVETVSKMKDRVRFTGFIPYHRLPEIYNIADIAVLPSIWDEPAGLTMIEALSCGVPLITTVTGGIPEYVNKDSAVLISKDDKLIENIAHKIEWLIKNPSLRQEMGKIGRNHVVKCFSSDDYAKKLFNILKA